MDSKAYIFNFYFLQHLALTPTPSLMTTYRYVSQYRSLSFTAFLCICYWMYEKDEKELVWLPSISFWLYIETYVVCRGLLKSACLTLGKQLLDDSCRISVRDESLDMQLETCLYAQTWSGDIFQLAVKCIALISCSHPCSSSWLGITSSVRPKTIERSS